jgi:ubiquinone/menaquinone biosynthesis C-methylase UbiE
MVSKERWRQAQRTEDVVWAEAAQSESTILYMLSFQAQRALQVRSLLRDRPRSCLEVGIGALGVGVAGFLFEVPFRVGVDPQRSVRAKGIGLLAHYVEALRAPIRYIVGCGEDLPIESNSMDLVLCCNVLDHTLDPDAILEEIARVLKPAGLFFLDVHTFSFLGLLKWHAWTKHKHRDEILVQAHPYRFFEPALYSRFKAHGFKVVERQGHSLSSTWVGHARTSVFLAVKQDLTGKKEKAT